MTDDRRLLLITGATGTLGKAFAQACDARGLAFLLTDRVTLAIDDPASVARALDDLRPRAVVNAAGWVRVDDAESEPDACMRANADGAAVLAETCAGRNIHLTTFSSDLVFDGTVPGGYAEADLPCPLGVYGQSKADAERRVAAAGGPALIVRTAAFFSPDDPHNFARYVERTLRAGELVRASDAHVVTPTYVPDLVDACLDLIGNGETGLRHLTNGEAVSWAVFARRIAAALGFDPAGVQAASPESLGWRAKRPADAALRTTFVRKMPTLDDAISRYVAARKRIEKRMP